MLQPVSFYIGLRYSKSRSRTGFVSFITFFSIAGILLGVASLITVVSVMNGFEGELKQRILGLVPHVEIAIEPSKQQHWQPLREQLLEQEQVTAVTPYVQSEVLLQSKKSMAGVLMLGVLPEFEQANIVSQAMVAGRFQSLADEGYQVIIGEALARKLSVHVGDQVRIVLPNVTRFTPMGRVPVQRTLMVSGIFNVGSQIDDMVIYLNLTKAARLLKMPQGNISSLRLYLTDAFQAQALADDIRETVAKDYQITTWTKSQGTLFSAVSMEKNMMWLMLSLIVAVAAFNIVSALVMVVVEKQGEIAILQTLGLNRLGIVQIFVTQGMINGLWGTLLGGVFGVGLALCINDITVFFGVSILGQGYVSQLLPVVLRWQDVTVILCSALFMTFLSTLYPALRAASTLPAEVLRNE